MAKKGNDSASRELKKHDISFMSLFFFVFALIAAGCYGIEDMISLSGPGLTLLLIVVLPFFGGIPQGLVSAELGSAIPDEGGYYVWVRRAMGEFWGFLSGWWRTIAIYIDTTLYVVLIAGYLEVFWDLLPWQSFLVKVTFILIFTYINIRGLKDVSILNNILSVFIIGTFVVLSIIGIAKWQHNPFVPFISEGEGLLGSLGFGIAACIWLYAGYESLGTVAGEIKRPHLIPRAILLSIPVIIALYAIPTMASIAAVGDWQNWATEGAGKISFVSIANYLQMPMLLLPFGIAAVASCSSLYSTYMASGTRGFYVLAEDKLCPKFFKDIHPKYGTPYKAILSMAVVNLVLCWFDFEVLVVIDVFFIMFAYIMIYIAAIILRIKEPGLPRPYRLPFGVKGLTAFCVPPTLLALMAIFYNGFGLFVAGCLGAISGPIAYYIFKRRYGGLDGAKVVSKKNIKNSLVFSSVMLAAIAIACLIQFIIHNS